MGSPVVHFEVTGRDAAALRSYYGALFGWEYDLSNPMDYGLVDRAANSNDDGIGIGGGIGPVAHGQAGGVTFYVEVSDVEAALARAEALGGKRLFGPDSAGPVTLGKFSDPEGHVIGLVQAE
jgi:predicted enzyme related to lactoylglutathione lyase